MKKIYQIPTVTVVRVDLNPILSDSLNYNEETDDTSGNLSRGGFWDDEDEE